MAENWTIQMRSMQDVPECSICTEPFDETYDHGPRVLPCGHTFCTKCLGSMISVCSIKCPVCSATHPITRPDPTVLPLNIAVMDVVKGCELKPQQQAPMCDVCRVRAAQFACTDCVPKQLVHFCATCDSNEHNRPFFAVRMHKRHPLNDAPRVFCSVHAQTRAIYYLERTNSFACQLCQSEEPEDCTVISEAARQLRQAAREWNQSIGGITSRCESTHQELTESIETLLPASCEAAKEKVLKTFTDLADILQQRQKQLMRRVDEEYKICKEKLEKQKEELAATLKNVTACREELNKALNKSDEDFLRSYPVIQMRAKSLLAADNSSLHSPAAPSDIPVVFDDCSSTLKNLGAVGGGPTPTDLTVLSSSSHCNLLKLQWGVPQGSDVPEEFQVDCQNLSGAPCPSPYNNAALKLLNVSGNSLTCYVDDFIPGCKYRFRIRSRNKASWGIWSPATADACRDFPIKFYYTKVVHKMLLPEDGLYHIMAKGAKGGNAGKRCGGQGAIVSATFELKAGDTLIVLSGGKSQEQKQNGTSGGGGGSFVALNKMQNILLVAGGGGGAQDFGGIEWDGYDASLETAGTPGRGSKGGKDGGPGEDAYHSGTGWGYGGAGALLKSMTACSFLEGGEGGQCGGFGGGGAASDSSGSPWGGGLTESGYPGGGGGGGGYSGGGGGGGGGGSYVREDGMNVEKKVGHNDNGCVVIQRWDREHPLGALRQESSASTGSNSSVNRAY